MCESPKAVTTEGTTNCYTKADARGHSRFRFLYILTDHLDHDRSRGITRSYSFRMKRNDSIRLDSTRLDLKAASCIRERNHFCHRSNHSITLSSLRPFAQSDRSNVLASPCVLLSFYHRCFSQFGSCFSSIISLRIVSGRMYVCVHRKRLLTCLDSMRMNG